MTRKEKEEKITYKKTGKTCEAESEREKLILKSE